MRGNLCIIYLIKAQFTGEPYTSDLFHVIIHGTKIITITLTYLHFENLTAIKVCCLLSSRVYNVEYKLLLSFMLQ